MILFPIGGGGVTKKRKSYSAKADPEYYGNTYGIDHH